MANKLRESSYKIILISPKTYKLKPIFKRYTYCLAFQELLPRESQLRCKTILFINCRSQLLLCSLTHTTVIPSVMEQHHAIMYTLHCCKNKLVNLLCSQQDRLTLWLLLSLTYLLIL